MTLTLHRDEVIRMAAEAVVAIAQEGSVTMKVEFVNPFVAAAREVLEKEVGCAIERGNLNLHNSAYTNHEVTAMIAVTGAVQGMVLYGLKQQTACAIVGRILGQPFEEFDELAQSGIAELANVITGRAGILLAEAGYPAQISPPALIIGNGTMISTLDLNRIVVPLQTEYGAIEAHVALREGRPAAE